MSDKYFKGGVRVVDMGCSEPTGDAGEDQFKGAVSAIFQDLTACSRKAASLGDKGKALERAIDAARDVAHRLR